MAQLISQIKAFNPTKIAVYADDSYDTELNANYQSYLKGTYEPHTAIGGPDRLSVSKTDGTPETLLYC